MQSNALRLMWGIHYSIMLRIRMKLGVLVNSKRIYIRFKLREFAAFVLILLWRRQCVEVTRVRYIKKKVLHFFYQYYLRISFFINALPFGTWFFFQSLFKELCCYNGNIGASPNDPHEISNTKFTLHTLYVIELYLSYMYIVIKGIDRPLNKYNCSNGWPCTSIENHFFLIQSHSHKLRN